MLARESLNAKAAHDPELVMAEELDENRPHEVAVACNPTVEESYRRATKAQAELARMHRDGQCHEEMVWYSPLEDFGRWQNHAGKLPKGLTHTSRAGIPKRPLPTCQAGPTASSTPLLLDAQMPWGGHLP